MRNQVSKWRRLDGRPLGLAVTLLLAIALSFLAISGVGAGSLTVTNTEDSGPGSLRRAISDGQPGDTIQFALARPATITLTSGELLITKPLTLTGPGPELLAVSGNGTSRVFRVDKPDGLGQMQVRISGLTIRDGFLDLESGGGLWNDADLSLSSVTFEENWAYGAGGGLASTGDGHLSLTTVVFHKNGTGWWGGGLDNWSASATLTDVLFRDNSSVWGNGGGMRNGSPHTTLDGVALYGNVADDFGGGLYSLVSSPHPDEC